MKIRQKFGFYNMIMLAAPIILIGVVSVLFLIIFVVKFPIEEMELTRAQLINPVMLIRAFGTFFNSHPDSVVYVFLWGLICIIIMVVTTTTITAMMARSIEQPLGELMDAAENIKNGSLNFEIMSSEYTEMENLCEGMDRMRRALIAAREREKILKNERSMMIANISHDLKTPVTSIKGYIDGIRDGVADTPQKLERYLDTIYSKAKTIETLVSNLSTFSRLELSSLEFDFTDGDIRDLIYDIIDSYRLDFEQSGIEIVYDISKSPIPVSIDGEKIKRTFANIVENAIKYRQKNSKKFVIRAFKEEGYAYVVFEDDGIGIKSKEIDKVFDTFYRADNSRTSQIKGNGLGLGIAKQIIEKHNGKIWLKSDGENKGTSVFVCIPIKQKERIQQ